MMIGNNKIVIVGAGMAGLTAAAYLTRKHYNVLLLDKNNRVGGLVNTFNQDGFFFDTGPRAFVNSGIVKPILADLGISCDYLENIGEIEKIISITYELSEYTKILYQFDNPNFVDLTSDKKFIFRELIPWTFKFLVALRKMNQFSMPMEEYLERITDNQSLTSTLTQMFFRKTPTYFAHGSRSCKHACVVDADDGLGHVSAIVGLHCDPRLALSLRRGSGGRSTGCP